jgi:MarR family transcriptional regulator, organic hydroperoxide resistance regulator
MKGFKIVAPMAKRSGQETPITEYLVYRLAQANRAINRQLKSRLANEGVLVEQWWILKVLSDGNGRSMSDLAEVVLLNHPTLTKIIDRMVSDTLVCRASDPKDRRKVLMFCSDRGRILCHQLDLLAMSQEAYIVQRCGTSSVSELKRLLKKLIDCAI